MTADRTKADAAALSAAAPFMGAVVKPRNADVDALRVHIIAQTRDPSSGLTVKERAFYALLSLPRAAQAICSPDEIEEVLRTVSEAMEAAVQAALSAASPFMGAVGWQPMDTAPKDGTRIWLCNNVMHAPIIGTWDDYRSEFSGAVSKQWIVTHDPCELFTPMRYGTLICPTKWAPLPVALIPAPVPATEAREGE